MQFYACLPPFQAMAGNEKEFLHFIAKCFVLLQNVVSGMGCLLKPVFYKQIKYINPMVLVISRKALHSVLYVYTMAIFILRTDNQICRL